MIFHGILLFAAVIAAILALGILFFGEDRSKAFIPGVIGGLILVMTMLQVVPAGHARVGMLFGAVEQRAYGPGLRLVNPLMGFEDYSTKRISIEFQSPSGNDQSNTDNLLTQTSDQVAMTIDVTFAFQLNAQCLPWLFQNIGDQNQVDEAFLRPIARSAVRDSTPRFSVEESLVSKRSELEATLGEVFGRKTVESLVAQGMSETMAATCITILPTQLRRTEPPRPILDAQADFVANQRRLATADVTVQIQTRLAEARRAEGQGLRNLAAEAPAGWGANGIAAVQNSQANLALAQAVRTAVDNGNVPVIVTSGGTTVQTPARQ